MVGRAPHFALHIEFFPPCPHAHTHSGTEESAIEILSDIANFQQEREPTSLTFESQDPPGCGSVSRNSVHINLLVSLKGPAASRPQILEILDDVIQILEILDDAVQTCQRQNPERRWTTTEVTGAELATVEPANSRGGQRSQLVCVNTSHRFARHTARASANICHG